MEAIRTVVKRVGKPPEVANVVNELKTWQAIVEGHCETVIVGSDGQYRMAIVCNEDGNNSYNSHAQWKRDRPMPVNFLFPGGLAIRGPAFIAKINGQGDAVDLTDNEIGHWVDFLTNANTRLPSADVDGDAVAAIDAEERTPPPYGLTDMHQVMILPVDAVDEDALPLTPEQQISRIAEQVGYRYRLVPLDNHDVYGVALTCLESQGHDYEMVDEEKMEISLPSEEGARVSRYLRVIEIAGLDERPQ